MPVVANLFDEEVKTGSKVISNLFDETPKNKVVAGLFGEEKPKTSLLQEAIIKPAKTFYGGVLKSAANLADTINFYSKKFTESIPNNALLHPLLKERIENNVFEYLRDNWSAYGEKLQKEGVSNKLIKEIYSGLGEAGFEIPKLMALGPQGLIVSGALEGGKAGGGKGAVTGAVTGALTKGMLRGLNVLPTKVKLPTAFGVGAVTTPGGLEEKVAGGTVLTGLSLGGRTPTMAEFKETQTKYSPLVKGYQKVLPYETRERIYQNYINRMQSIENIVDKAKSLGAKILPGENPALRARTYLGIGQKVKTVLEDKTYRITPEGKLEITGEGLRPILNDYDKKSPIKGRELRDKDLTDYLIAQRTIKDLQRPKSEFTQENIVTPEQVKTAQGTLDRLGKKYGVSTPTGEGKVTWLSKGSIAEIPSEGQKIYAIFPKDTSKLKISKETLPKQYYRYGNRLTQEEIIAEAGGTSELTASQEMVKILKAKGINPTDVYFHTGKLSTPTGEGKVIPHLDQTATRLYDYQKRVLSNLVDSGNLSQEQYDIILAKNPNYVPFDRVIEGVDTAGTPVSKNRFTGARSPIKRIKGSELEIHNPIESMIKNTYRIMDIAERNTVARGVAKLGEVLPKEISPVEVKMVPVATVEHKAAIDVNFQNQLVNFAKSLGAKFKTTGQIGRQLGVYYPSRTEITRKFATPREVLSHETAHFFDDKFGLKQKFYKRGESKAVTEELIGLMQRMGESQNRINKPQERFADGFEWWLTHRDLAQRDLPLFSKSMEGIIKDVPQLKPVLQIEPQPAISVETMRETIFRPSQFKPKGNIIEYFDGGKRKYMEVTPNLYQAMTGLNETSTSLLTKIMSIPAGTLRTGATITPEFMLRNPIRDQWTALMQTKLGFKPFVDNVGAIADIMGKSEVYNDWLRSGGAYSGFVELSRPNLQKKLNALKGNSSLLSKLNIITRAQDISQLFEQATRLGVYKVGIKKGLTPVEAGFQSREATVDFGRKGAKTKDINAVIAFFNAGIQGTDKLVRTAKEDPIGFAAKGIATITIPSLITYVLNRDDPEYKELPHWQKDLFWIFKVNDTFIRIPKPFAYGQFFGSLPERFMEYLDTQDPQAFNRLNKSLYDSLTPASGDPTGSLMATGIKPLVENATNWSFFRERPIIPEGAKRKLPAEQYTKYTSETTKGMGRLLNYSPAKIENIIQGWFGGSGKYVLQTLDLVGKGIGKFTGDKTISKRPIELTDIPLIKGFVVPRPLGSQSESVNNFYENMDKVTQVYSTIRQYLQSKDKVTAEKLKSKYPEFKAYQGINKTAKILSDLSNYSDYIIRSNKPEKEKRELLKEIDRKKTEIAQKANEAINKFRVKKNLVIPDLFK